MVKKKAYEVMVRQILMREKGQVVLGHCDGDAMMKIGEPVSFKALGEGVPRNNARNMAPSLRPGRPMLFAARPLRGRAMTDNLPWLSEGYREFREPSVDSGRPVCRGTANARIR